MLDFDQAYARLNDAQRQAVDAIEGPVMVVAGPGTGKTQVLALRVANILRKTHMRPGNILCLTFSVSGATAMRERLRSLIGADAYGVTVSTIHGFCQSVITQNAAVFDEWSRLEQIGDIEKYRELDAIIDTLAARSELINPKDPYSRDADILARISQVKREGKTSADLERAADAYDAAMAGKSKPGTKAHENNLAAARKFREFVGIFGRYQDMLRTSGRYDYDDMILFVLRALQQEEWLLSGLQERFQYILVDEAQDTNGAQWAVVNALTTNPAVPNDPNVFIVGDDDQAIYRFQGANLQNMLSFHQRFPQAPVIALTVSYRSTQQILSAAQSLIERNEERLIGRIPGLEKQLTAHAKEQGEPPVLLRAPSDVAEPWLIADLVEERIARGIAPQEIAVITQTNAELFPLYDVLTHRGLPVLLQGKADLLSQPVVRDAYAVLKAAAAPENDALLLTALGTEALGCRHADVARLSFAAREERRSALDLLADLEESDLPLLSRDALIAARDRLLQLVHSAKARTTLETVEQALRLVIGAGQKIDPLPLAAAESYFHFAKERCLRTPTLSLQGFLKDLAFYADPEYGQVSLTFSLPHLVREGVQLMTAHQSKGLEFHTVILTNFRDGHWDNRRKPGGVAIPEDLLFGWDVDRKQFEKGQDERRVAFVAMTRAKRELVFSCPLGISVGEKYKPVSPSAFFAQAGQLPEREAALANPEQASLLLSVAPRNLDEELRAYLRQRLEHFALSATSLSRFLRDPQEFLAVDLLGQPEQLSEASMRSLGFGNAVHWALREWGTAVRQGEACGEQRFLEAFRWHLENKNILTDQQRSDLLALGNTALPAYFAKRLEGARPHLYAVEREYKAHLGDIPIKGKIDRIDQLSPTSGDVLVIDYKTGSPKTERDIRGGLEPGEVSTSDEGDKFRQIVFYALLLEKADPLVQPVGFAMDFVGERDEPSFVELRVTEGERTALRALIASVWEKIVNLDFTPLTRSAPLAVLQSAIQEQKSRTKKKTSGKAA